MSSISAVSGSYYSNYSSYVDTSGTAIEQSAIRQVNGYDTGSENITSAQSVLNITDDALGQITDYLQSIYEISVKASNTAVYSSDDIDTMQSQIDQYLKGITDIASNTTYNEKNLLDGSITNFDITTDANGSTSKVSTANATLQALGIDGYNIKSGDWDVSSIEDAMKKVNSARSSAGAQSNALTYKDAYNQLTSQNTLASSSVDDQFEEIIKKYSEDRKQELLDNVRMIMQKKDEEQMKQSTMNLFV